MDIVSSSYGISLVFQKFEDLKSVIKQLSDFVEHIEAEPVTPPPYIYHQGDARIPPEEADKYTDWLKYCLKSERPN